MSEETQPILCGKCSAPVSYKEEGQEDSLVGCAPCDNWGSRDEVVQIASEYARDAMQIKINRMARNVASKSKMMTFSGQVDLSGSYRFIVGGIL